MCRTGNRARLLQVTVMAKATHNVLGMAENRSAPRTAVVQGTSQKSHGGILFGGHSDMTVLKLKTKERKPTGRIT